MKKLSYMFFVTIFSLATIVLLSSWTFAQPISLEGTWKARVAVFDLDDHKAGASKNIIGSICQYPETPGVYNVPFLFFYGFDDPEDPFFGFIRDDIFSLFKHNQHGPNNLGREIIIGKVNNKGDFMQGRGNGFDSNMEWGSSWSELMFTAEKVSDTPQIVCPSLNPWFCFYPFAQNYPCLPIEFR